MLRYARAIIFDIVDDFVIFAVFLPVVLFPPAANLRTVANCDNPLETVPLPGLEKKKAITDGAITKQEYTEWILTWPYSTNKAKENNNANETSEISE